MKTEVNMESLEGMSFADYKKALKKDKKFLKKANGVMFVNDHKFSDGKKGLAMMIFKKPKEVKQCFKDLKKKGHPSPKMAGGSCELVQGDNGPEFKVELKLGGLKEDKIMAKGKSYFKSVLGLMPTIVAPDPKDSDGQVDAEEQEEINDLVADLNDIKKMGPAVKKAIDNFKAQTANQDDAEAVEDFVAEVRDWLVAFKNEVPDVKAKLKDHALKLKDQYVKLNPLVAKIKEQADKNDPQNFFEKMMDKAGDFVDKVKDKVEDLFDGDDEAWEDDDIDDIGENQMEDSDDDTPDDGVDGDDNIDNPDDSTQTDDDIQQDDDSQVTAPVVNEVPVANNIEKSVGKGGVNDADDVRVVQTLLNEHGANLEVDGACGPATIAAIEKFQKDVFGWADGRVDPDGKTWGAMAGAMPSVNDDQGDEDLDDDDEEMIEVSGSGPSSSYFSFKEMVSKNDPVYKANNGDPTKVVPQEYWPNLQKLMKQLDVIRGALGVAVTVNSAYRSPEHNKNVGGVANSQHLFGKAADLSCSISPQEVHAIIAGLIQAGKIAKGGLGLYNTFVHYDIRGSIANWNNSGFTPLPPKMPNIVEDDDSDQDDDVDNTTNDTVVDTVDTGSGEVEEALSPTSKISASVGKGGVNKPEDVLRVKQLLNKFGHTLEENGTSDAALIAAIEDFQRKYRGMPNPDGRVDAGGGTWRSLLGIGRIQGQLSTMAQQYGVEPAVILAIQQIESGGNGFLSDGRPKILFEGHVFWRQLEAIGKNPLNYVSGNEDILYPSFDRSKYEGGAKEYDRLERAKKIDKIAALKSASWGEFQIMGFNHSIVGYSDVESFVEAMHVPNGSSLKAVMEFVKNRNLLRYVQGSSKNWAKFAEGYNGSGYWKNKYDEKLAAAYERYKGII